MKNTLTLLAFLAALPLSLVQPVNAATIVETSGQMLKAADGVTYHFWMTLGRHITVGGESDWCPGANKVADTGWDFDCPSYPGLGCSKFTFVTDQPGGITFTRGAAWSGDLVYTSIPTVTCKIPPVYATEPAQVVVVLDFDATFISGKLLPWLAGEEPYFTVYIGKIVMGLGGTIQISTAACDAPEPRCGAVFAHASTGGAPSQQYDWKGEMVEVTGPPAQIWRRKQRLVRD